MKMVCSYGDSQVSPFQIILFAKGPSRLASQHYTFAPLIGLLEGGFCWFIKQMGQHEALQGGRAAALSGD
jgi:hypothetical protein